MTLSARSPDGGADTAAACISARPPSPAQTRDGQPIRVAAREFALLEFLMRHRGDVVSKRQIIDNVGDAHFDGDPNIVEVYVGYLRRKIDQPFGRRAIQTERGMGYRLAADGG
ncbi:winged helix-turn-helix domain-containing protein [Micromonospora lupini]|uniref:winged helix-turn-helix domain-containing protein n=1 Tax=Micromonospora lupini TaxID=285679 RepID=UPI0033F9DA7D